MHPNVIKVHPLPTSRLVEGKAITIDREPYWNHSFKCPFNLWVVQTSSAGNSWSWAPGCRRYETRGLLLQSALHAKIWLPAGYLEWPEGNVVTRIPGLNVFWLNDHFQGDYLVLGMFGECSYAGFQGYGWIWLHQTLHKTCTGRTTTETIWRSIEVLFRHAG